MTLQDIPALNAFLNAIATVAITAGLVAIRGGAKDIHRRCMLTAAAVSAVFLIGYVSHKILVRGVHTPFGGTGLIRGLYYGMLLTHVVLAMAIAWLVPRTFLFALRGQWEQHRAWARWTMPIWLYVSVTGVLVYFFLYQWWPASR
ncbi:DUF420 domain-containing protein [Nibricoccus sp. IMCC34717]|uniref:DUF420 domain-containing protein n=1 Tax=Nibricoccus sp. IMCC34717 TaxID=3034021 RepID=UPI00384E6B96